MQMNTVQQTGREEDEIQLRDIWNIVRRNRLLIAGCFALAVLGGVAYALLATPVYEAETSIRVDDKQASIPSLDILKMLTAAGGGVPTEAEVVQSRTLAEDVVDSLHLQVVVASPRRIPRDSILAYVTASRTAPEAEYRLHRGSNGRFSVVNRETKARLGEFAPGERIALDSAVVVLTPAAAEFRDIRVMVYPFQETVEALQKVLKVSRPNREANIIVARYQSADLKLVRDVPNMLAARFMARRQEVQKTEARSTVRFLREQLDTLSTQLTKAENALQTFREGERVVNLQAEAASQVTRLAELQAQRIGIAAERDALAKLLADIGTAAANRQPDQPSPYRRLIAFPTLLRNQAAAEMLRSLAAVEDQRAALLIRRLPEDPDVQMLSTRVAELEEQLRSIATTYHQGLINQVASLDGALGQFKKELERTPAKEVEFIRLQRQPKVLEDIYTLLQARLKEAEVAQAVEDPSVRVVDVAITPSKPVKPRKKLVVVLAAMLGLLVGCAAAFVRESMDRAIHTREDVQAIADVPVLGLIPRIVGALGDGSAAAVGSKRLAWLSRLPLISKGINGAGQRNGNGRAAQLTTAAEGRALSARLVTGADPRSPVSEAYRTMRTSITFARPDTTAKTLLFTSAMPGDGKTTSAANLAITLAQQGVRVLLIDADMRRGMLNSVFDLRRDPGLSNVLFGAIPFENAVRRIELGESGSLDVLCSGILPPNPAELLGSGRMRALLDQIEREYEMIIFDAPPVNLVTDAALLSTSVDGVMLVARAGVTSMDALGFAAQQLRTVRAPLLGAVLNDVDFKRDATYYGSYGAYQQYYAFGDSE